MKDFLRALKMASRYWPSVALATACSFAVAALWGANIGAFYPILEVTIRGKSAQEWLDIETDKLEKAIASTQLAIESKTAEIQQRQQPPNGDAALLASEIDDLKHTLALQEAKVQGYERLEPWVARFAPKDPFSTIIVIVVALIITTAVRHVFLIGNEMLVGRVAFDISRELRGRIFESALVMDRGSYLQHGSASFVTLIVHTTDMLSQGLMNVLGAALREPLKLIACLVGAAAINSRLLVLSVVISPVMGCILYYVTRKIKSVSTRLLEQATGFHEVLLESLANINTVQAFGREDWEKEKFHEATLSMKRFGLKFLFITSLAKPVIEFLGVSMLGTTIMLGSYLVLNKETHIFGFEICAEPMSVSALLVFFGMLIGISDPLRKLSAVYGAVYGGTIAANAVFKLLDRESLIKTPENPVEVATPHQTLALQSVGFSYDKVHPILQDVSLEIPFGKTLAIVGANGSGKSTLINLLCRFYDTDAGALRMDGVDLREMDIEALRNRISLVNQETQLFNDTVAYNIRYGMPNASDEEVRWAAIKSHAHEFIENLPNGYDTIVGPNGNFLSGGQRQRIALARALICKPEILILDEATSQIDMQSEQLIRESLAELRGEQTIIIITHREKLLELVDEAYEFSNGQLTQWQSPSTNAA